MVDSYIDCNGHYIRNRNPAEMKHFEKRHCYNHLLDTQLIPKLSLIYFKTNKN